MSHFSRQRRLGRKRSRRAGNCLAERQPTGQASRQRVGPGRESAGLLVGKRAGDGVQRHLAIDRHGQGSQQIPPLRARICMADRAQIIAMTPAAIMPICTDAIRQAPKAPSMTSTMPV